MGCSQRIVINYSGHICDVLFQIIEISKMKSKYVLCLFVLFIITTISTAEQSERKKKSWRDKDIRDMTDADLEHLLDQWEVCLSL